MVLKIVETRRPSMTFPGWHAGERHAQGHRACVPLRVIDRRLDGVAGHAGIWSVPLEIGSGEASML